MSFKSSSIRRFLSTLQRFIGQLFTHICPAWLHHWLPPVFLDLEHRRMEAILSAIHEPSFAIDLNGKIFFWNHGMEEMSGLRAKDMLGKGDYAYALAFYGARRPILIDYLGLPLEVTQAHYPKVLREGESLISETETNHPSLGKGLVCAIASPLYDRAGNRVGSIEQVRDETELRRAATKITNLSLAVEQSPNGTIICDKNSIIEYANEAFVDMYGYTKEELIGRPVGILSSGETPKRTIEAMWTALNQGLPWKGELVNRRKDGQHRVIFSRASPIRQSDGSVNNYLAIQEDMTERKRIGQELDRHRHHLQSLVTERTAELEGLKEAAEAANEAKSAFLANMSHEIRTPMNGIIGLTRIVHQKTTDPEHRRQLGQVLETSYILLGMINDILDLSKIEAHKLTIEHIDFHLEPLLKRQLDLIHYQAETKGLHLYAEIDPELLTVLRGDPLRIGQILLNFLGNAVKFTEQGSITIQAKLLETPINANGLPSFLIRFNVIDTGIGIPESVCSRLFQAFEQGDVSVTRKFGGTGLGLVISRHLAEMMGGDAGVSSEEGKGSCFWFTVLLDAGQAENAGHESSAPMSDQISQVHALGARFPGLRILLAEDNKINQEVALSLFQGSGFTIDVAENGAQALKKARAAPYDLILMDIQMPVMDGLTTTRQIRRLSWHQDTPIIAMTANAFDEDRAECLAAGMNAHIGKPVSPTILYTTIGALLARNELAHGLVVPQQTPPEPPSPPSHSAPLTVENEEIQEHSPPTGAENPLALLRDIVHLNTEIGLASLGGRVKPYLRILRKFALSQDEDSAALLSALQSIHSPTGRDEARRLAHSLKGVAGTLGMPTLQNKAAELENALKSNADENEILRLGSELSPLRQELASTLLALLPPES